MKKTKIAVVACAAIMSMSSMSLTTEALGNQTLTSAASTAITSVVELTSSFSSKTASFKSDYTSTTNAIRLNWNKVSGASGYRIYKYDSSAKKWVKVKTVKSGSTTTARITGLSAGSKYRFKVKAYKHYNGKTYWSKASSAKYAATKPKQVTMKASTATCNAIRLNWKKVKCDGYKIYQKVNGKYKLIATVRNSDTTTYKVTGLSSGTKYTFKVRAYRKDTAGKVVYGKCGVKEKTTLEFKAPTIKSVTQSGNTFTIKWSKVACDGYIVYSLAGWASGGFSKLTTITNSNTTSFTFDPNDSEYFTPWGCGFSDGLIFKVRAYILDSSGNKVFSKGAVSDTYYSLAYLRNTYSDGIKILKKATKSSANKSKVSDADKKILKEFADTYFQDGWSDMDKIVYTYIWLMHSLTYAETTEQWNKVVGLSYVDAAFNKKLGQCIQYNGALTAMINYLGYDASVVGGLSGWGYQHFWCEMTIDGVVYVLDAHLDILCEPYETSGYKKY